MPAALRRDEADRWIVGDFCGLEQGVRHKRVVLRGDEKEWHTDLRGDALGADAFVVILSITIAEAWSDDEIVELADGMNRR